MTQNATAAERVILHPHDLPLHCSGPKHETWNGHPRVFLPIKSYGTAQCPYCGTEYYMDGEIKAHH